ncbi:AAA family ATPase [Methanobacterium alcaliphilum]|uniref:ATP-binding protein n=1 Tax=Methanobacterium alcaliphilum TaxID=392018 RepID=UPI00200B8EFE|nr:AAA family ATPase [Methanobacterium alcaliphilum]
MIIAVSGKGGTGKTMVSATLIKLLMQTDKDILAIDADPDSNLPEALGVPVEKTVGDVREELKKDTASGSIPASANKWDILDYKIMESIIETPNFDLLVMGRPEGSGCYCAVNNMLRKIIETLSSNYDAIVIDTEAGLEHLSRRTTQNVDVMLVVTDTSHRGILTAQRIGELAKELDINFKELYLVLNRVKKDNEEVLRKKVAEIGIELVGIIYEDSIVSEYDMAGKPLIELPDESYPVKSITDIINKILI